MKFSLTILGSSSALPTKTRNLSAQVLNLNEKVFLIDCADGTQMQLKRCNIKTSRINHIFISHLHGDHFFGLIGLVSSMHLLGREADLHIYGPEKLETIIRSQLEMVGTQLKYTLHFHHLKPGESELLLEGPDFYVRSFPLLHGVTTWGFLFSEKELPRNIKKEFADKHDIPFDQFSKIKDGEDYHDEKGNVYNNKDITTDPPKPRSYAYCSDTQFSEKTAMFARGVDLLYHEATYADDKKDEAADNTHSTAKDAATVAKLAGASRLIIGHFSARYKEADTHLSQAKEIFDHTIVAEDGMVVDVPR